MLDRLPTNTHTINEQPRGPLATRPFGLDALTNSRPVDHTRAPALAVDADSQLSVFNGATYLDTAIRMEGTSCNTESDGKDVIAVDTDGNDD